MARSETIIVGGAGIAPGPVFNAGKVLQAVQTDPPLVGDTKITVTPIGSSALTSQITIPGEGTNSTVIGAGVAAPSGHTRCVYIGNNFSFSDPASIPDRSDCIVIGADFTRTAADAFKEVRRTVAIGSAIILGSGGTANGVAIGYGVRIGGSATDSFSCVAIGVSAQCQGGSSVAIGPSAQSMSGEGVAIGSGAGIGLGVTRSVSIGGSSSVSNSHGVAVGGFARVFSNDSIAIGSLSTVPTGGLTAGIAIGKEASTGAANQLAIGSATAEIREIVLGASQKSINIGYTARTLLMRITEVNRWVGNGNITNATGWSMRIAAARGTGNASGAEIQFATPSIEASGTTRQTDVEQFAVLQSNGALGSANLRIRNVANHAGVGVVPNINNAPNAAGGDPVGWVPIQVDFGAGPVTVAFPVWSL